jgi:DNA-binding NarL/FixJ family response regulator
MSKSTKGLSSQTSPRLLVIDANAVYREGVRAIVARAERFELCDDLPKEESPAHLVERHKPDLVLIEPFEEGRDGVLLIKDLTARFPKLPLLVVSQKPEEVYAERILRAGASGYWMKSGASEELIRSIETVLSGELYFSPRVAHLAVRTLLDAPRWNDSPTGGLTDRELHVYGLIGAGFGPGRIAGDLGLSRKTVETYQDRIKTKLGYLDAKELRDGARTWLDSVSA